MPRQANVFLLQLFLADFSISPFVGRWSTAPVLPVVVGAVGTVEIPYYL
jgi:hypothetical protein